MSGKLYSVPPLPSRRSFISQHSAEQQYHDQHGHSVGFGPRDVRITSQALTHILDGELDDHGHRHGGHTMRALRRWKQEGVNVEGLIIFPADWSDATIIHGIRRVIASPDSVVLKGSRAYMDGVIDGVLLRVT